MNLTTQQFLELIVPQTGEKFISIDRGAGRWNDMWAGETHADMLEFIEKYQSKTVNIYHANATFIDADGGRKAANVANLKALWLDLDVQKKGASYDSQKDAIAAVMGFV